MVRASDGRVQTAILHPCASGILLGAQFVAGRVIFALEVRFWGWRLHRKTGQPAILFYAVRASWLSLGSCGGE